jgi:hypothetical protein
MSSTFERNMAYRHERERLVEQATYTMADAIREVEEEDAVRARAAAAAAQNPNEYVFAPKDASGRPLVAPFVIKYTDAEDLRQKLIAETANVKYLLNRDKLTVAETGAPEPADFAAEVQRFIDETPGYYKCQQNFNLIVMTAEQNHLAPTFANLTAVYAALTKQGMLIGPNGKTATVNTSGDKTGISYTLRDGRVIYGRQALEAMPPDEYKRRMFNDPTFPQRADKCWSERQPWQAHTILSVRVI